MSAVPSPNVPRRKTAKLVFIGDPAVGKSSILECLVNGRSAGSPMPTIGVGFDVLKRDNDTVHLQLWDMSGDEKFRSITTTYMRNATGIIMVYDVTRGDTFTALEAKDGWLPRLMTCGTAIHPDTGHLCLPVLLIGNKIDLVKRYDEASDAVRAEFRQCARDHVRNAPAPRAVLTADATELARRHGFEFVCETSAADWSPEVTGHDKMVFEQFVARVLERVPAMEVKPRAPGGGLNVVDSKKKQVESSTPCSGADGGCHV